MEMIINQAVDKYHRLDEILRNQMLEGEDAAFLRGRKFELMLLIYTLDEQVVVPLTENPVDDKPEMVSLSLLREFNLN